MMRLSSTVLVCLTLGTILPAGFAHADPAPIDPNDVAMTLEVASGPVLPFQPVRIRMTIRNVSKHRLGPILPVDEGRGVVLNRGPNDTRYTPSRAELTFRQAVTPSTRSMMNRHAPLYLEPGEQSSVSFALGSRREEAGGIPAQRDPVFALFPEPGEYWLKCSYGDLEKEVKVEVREPEGDDRAAYQALRKNPKLAAALVEGFQPPEAAVVPKLEALLQLFPDSSYANPARYAVARYHLQGNGFVTDDGANKLPGSVTRVDRAKAATYLEEITETSPAGGFAYYPNAMIALKTSDPHFYESGMVGFQWPERYSDCVEWLELFATTLLSTEPKDERFVELVVGRKFPVNNDHTAAKDAKAQFKAEVWSTIRKRAPSIPNKNDRKP